MVQAAIRRLREPAYAKLELVGLDGRAGDLAAALSHAIEHGSGIVLVVAYGLVAQELERGDSGLRSFSSVQGALVMYPIYAFGSEEQRQHWLPKMATGEVIGCFGLTEPDFGSNPGGMLTRAVKDGDDWVLNGAKMWITNGRFCHIMALYAKTEPEGVTGFMVDRHAEGMVVGSDEEKLGQRGSPTKRFQK